ncbi:putative S-adenosylmethionine-dependent methyltransferase [Candidatus Nitrosocosmicus oleophilus]|uniref:Putative S-adenosylmethionine-dependent methyltransferase n=1 Tax=Candidatus Nitrosocosmicus oleophilus TaxID=1353260 RepID=A0A654M1E9_9ARCH|nr:class I SAM-dependent methyltransferase [Candidatus Nitrosocosmicus oleophilus]ALI36780.1 putative S-adenosylmethionine-dependent methyltransferase [Candidatus Nitrosocosmicus oleophilus]
MRQNLWDNKGIALNRQIRRSQVVKKSLDRNSTMLLDIGCAEGFTTNFIKNIAETVIGLELNFEYLKIAIKKVTTVHFLNASIEFLPFREKTFDAVTILEVLEHLPTQLQVDGLREASRVLQSTGTLIISVPYKEQRTFTTCIHCNKDTPLYGHLHSLDEDMIGSILPNRLFEPVKKYYLPHLEMISCLNIFRFLPLSAWLKINNILGKFNVMRGYWIVLKYIKI